MLFACELLLLLLLDGLLGLFFHLLVEPLFLFLFYGQFLVLLHLLSLLVLLVTVRGTHPRILGLELVVELVLELLFCWQVMGLNVFVLLGVFAVFMWGGGKFLCLTLLIEGLDYLGWFLGLVVFALWVHLLFPFSQLFLIMLFIFRITYFHLLRFTFQQSPFLSMDFYHLNKTVFDILFLFHMKIVNFFPSYSCPYIHLIHSKRQK